MMWGTWLFWILVGGLVLVMFSRGGCGGHARHGKSRNDDGHTGHGGPVGEGREGDASRKAGGGCH